MIICLLTGAFLLLVLQPDRTLPTDVIKAMEAGKSQQAVELLTKILSDDATHSMAYYHRGRENFRLGRITESIADFDQHVRLSPELEPRQWERGIALYYAGEYARGAKQFELYQTFDNRDVENSVWRFLCMARDVGVAEAREAMLPIKNDRRVPMMQVFDMYRGKLAPEGVLEAAHADAPPAQMLAGRLFYAHLYLGLYYEATGDSEQAQKYIALAASDEVKAASGVNSYMWDVARVHRQLRTRENKK